MTIDGVRVLAQEAINETPDFVFVIAGLLYGCMVLFVVLLLIIDDAWAIPMSVASGIIALLWTIIAGVCGVFNRPSDRYVYKCIFDEDVSIQEIYDEYEVVGRDGEIWILEDKE